MLLLLCAHIPVSSSRQPTPDGVCLSGGAGTPHASAYSTHLMESVLMTIGGASILSKCAPES